MTNEYALFNSYRNRFIIVDDDYENLKNIQLITMNYELLYLVDLNGIINYRPNLLSNDRCMNVTIANGEKLRIEIDMYFTNPSYRLIPAKKPASQDDEDYQKKIFFLSNFLKETRNKGYHILQRDLKQVDHLKRGLRGFKKFMSMTVPEDLKVQEFIDREIANKDIPKQILEEFQGILVRLLFDQDYSQSLDDIKGSLREKIRAVPVSAYYFTESISESLKLLQHDQSH